MLCTGLDPDARATVHQWLESAPPDRVAGSAAEQYLRQLASGRSPHATGEVT